MKTLLIAINAKYIHSNLAVYSLKASAGQWKDEVEIAEYTINHLREDILADIYRRTTGCGGHFPAIIWNIEYVQCPDSGRTHARSSPRSKIWLGGPEVSYDCEAVLARRHFPSVRASHGRGRGDHSAGSFWAGITGRAKAWQRLTGLACRDQAGQIHAAPARGSLMKLDETPFCATGDHGKISRTGSYIMKAAEAALFPAATVFLRLTNGCASGVCLW